MTSREEEMMEAMGRIVYFEEDGRVHTGIVNALAYWKAGPSTQGKQVPVLLVRSGGKPHHVQKFQIADRCVRDNREFISEIKQRLVGA